MGMKPAEHPLVTVLPEPVRVDLLAQVRRVSHPAGAVILAEGTLSTDFFLILEGTVEIVRGEEVLATLEEGRSSASWARRTLDRDMRWHATPRFAR